VFRQLAFGRKAKSGEEEVEEGRGGGVAAFGAAQKKYEGRLLS